MSLSLLFVNKRGYGVIVQVPNGLKALLLPQSLYHFLELR